jgi:hypothetical protein
MADAEVTRLVVGEADSPFVCASCGEDFPGSAVVLPGDVEWCFGCVLDVVDVARDRSWLHANQRYADRGSVLVPPSELRYRVLSVLVAAPAPMSLTMVRGAVRATSLRVRRESFRLVGEGDVAVRVGRRRVLLFEMERGSAPVAGHSDDEDHDSADDE